MTSVDRYMHVKGGIYDVIGEGHLQTQNGLVDMDDVVIYRSLSDGTLWARGRDEFFDGRFTAIARIELDEKDPVGYDVLMDLMHKMVDKIRKHEDHVPLFELQEQLTKIYPEAEILIQKRWSKK